MISKVILGLIFRFWQASADQTGETWVGGKKEKTYSADAEALSDIFVSNDNNEMMCSRYKPRSNTCWNSPSDTPSTMPDRLVQVSTSSCIRRERTSVEDDTLRLRSSFLLCCTTVVYVHLQHSLMAILSDFAWTIAAPVLTCAMLSRSCIISLRPV